MTTAQGGPQQGQRILDRYELVRFIARGGMGAVWEARDLTLDQVVALKHVSFASLPEADAEETRRRTLREARFAAQLRGHHHVVAIYDVMEVEGDVWLVLEYLPSRSLSEITEDGTVVEISEAARIGAAVADALAVAHQRGITHRDVKPGNVLLGADGSVKLTDFGISHAEGENPLTAVDVVSGTPAYMSREVARGEPETASSDVFSLGATLYKAVEGQPPFGEEPSSIRMLHRVAYGQVDPPRRAGPFGPLLMHLLELDPATRPDAAAAQRMLQDFRDRFRNPTRPSATAAAPPFAPPPGTPGTGPFAGPGSAPDPGERRRRGVLIAAVAAALVLVVVLVTGGILLAARTTDDPNAPPALPETVAAVTMTGDPRAADPCALIDARRMTPFGVGTVGPGSDTGQCRLTLTTPGGGSSFTELHFSNAAVESVATPGPPQNLDGLSISRLAPQQGTCTTYIQLPDATLIGVDTRSGTTTAVANACDITEGAVEVAVGRLAAGGITYRPGWQPGALAKQDACRLAGAATSLVPGLAGQRLGYPNGSTCYVGSAVQGQPYVRVTLGLEPSGQMGSYGTPGTAAGLEYYTSSTPAYYNGTACSVQLVRPRGSDSVGSTAEYIGVIVEGPGPFEEQCGQAGGFSARMLTSIPR